MKKLLIAFIIFLLITSFQTTALADKPTQDSKELRLQDMEITFGIEPDDGGHHVLVGKDKMTYQISYGPDVKLINHTHLKTYKYPPPDLHLQGTFDFNRLPNLFKYVLKKPF